MNQAHLLEISKVFFPDWFIQKSGEWICPICNRPHHKEPGPFICGMSADKTDNSITIWIQSSGCCKWNQYFPYEDVKKRKIKSENIISVIQEVFLHLPKKKGLIK